ncbi:MAG: DUF1345 domain-containing protein [Nakamurella sp.]
MTHDSGAPPPPAGADPPTTRRGRVGLTARARLGIAGAVGVVVGVAVGVPWNGASGVLIGWIAAAAVFTGTLWRRLWPMTAADTARHAVAENPGRALTDVAVLGAAVASLAAVALLLAGGGNPDVEAALSLGSLAASWISVHTIFTTRYARLYYAGTDGGIDFNQPEPPRYADFAYLAFTIGMTFQVSDTDLRTSLIRTTALRHALLSFLFGSIILAATINLVAGLAK